MKLPSMDNTPHHLWEVKEAPPVTPPQHPPCENKLQVLCLSVIWTETQSCKADCPLPSHSIYNMTEYPAGFLSNMLIEAQLSIIEMCPKWKVYRYCRSIVFVTGVCCCQVSEGRGREQRDTQESIFDRISSTCPEQISEYKTLEKRSNMRKKTEGLLSWLILNGSKTFIHSISIHFNLLCWGLRKKRFCVHFLFSINSFYLSFNLSISFRNKKDVNQNLLSSSSFTKWTLGWTYICGKSARTTSQLIGFQVDFCSSSSRVVGQ